MIAQAHDTPLIITYTSLGDSLTKEASSDGGVRSECMGIMDKIYKEDPTFWPYGISISGMDGGVYMLRDALTKEACGFVGWQERRDAGKKVGYYSIGVLPEHRGKGFAKEAVSKIINMKSRGVDEVRAFIAPHNKPSHALAESLQIPVEHE